MRFSLSSYTMIWFFIVHATVDELNSLAAYHERMITVTSGPDWVFETGNVGALTRHVPAHRVVCAVPPRLNKPKKPKPPRKLRTPNVVKTLRKALTWREELESGVVATQADIARREGLSRARVTQVMMLLRLAPEIQESILSLSGDPRPPRLTEKMVRPIACIEKPEKQLAAFEGATGYPS